jgi:chromosome partitioning protein
MHILAFIGAKGGTLKTASAAAVAHVCAGVARVVMIDLDPQADLTSRSNFSRVADPLGADPVKVRFEGDRERPLWLLRGGRALEGADYDAIRQHIARAAALEPDLVVIDTPPALGPITRAAARAAAYIMIPSEPGKESLTRAHDVITVATDGGHDPLIRILLTKVNRQTNLYTWMTENVDELYPGMRLRTFIPHETAAAESAIFERPVTVSAPKSRCAEAYTELGAEVLGRLDIRPNATTRGAA